MILKVTPEKLGTTAEEIRTLATDYNGIREQMYQEVTNLSSKWQGEDNLKFTAKITEALDSLQGMITALNNEASVLEAQKQSYQNRQQTIIEGL